eukprot:CAMPEP_0181174438 /NCGR_PEP_ID=MMETSP1096-20121128/3535_1 /TAXON_ID=156174 ORGANISM="Chrysochromulina ericina, Strain CCMP281" /NCGR_SAMPLE_ID=MMETSP1096 /ASSEMBLY_ACC=CAM_ASM_000453 /LENGTH=368 /DNA_ID=CAMNT_0023262337 /DNA_START=239 /DNA_END=1345 /DNA_ORIENTATION=+
MPIILNVPGTDGPVSMAIYEDRGACEAEDVACVMYRLGKLAYEDDRLEEAKVLFDSCLMYAGSEDFRNAKRYLLELNSRGDQLAQKSKTVQKPAVSYLPPPNAALTPAAQAAIAAAEAAAQAAMAAASLAISEPRALLPGAPEVDVAAIVALGAGLGADVPKVQVGSGFFCSSEGFLITCHHVLLDLQQVAPGANQICVGVGSPLTWTYRAEVLWISSRPGLSPQRHGDPMLDLAIMRVTSCLDHAQKLDSFPFLRLSDSDTARQGDRIWIYGYGQQRSDITDTSNVVSGDLAGKHTDADGNWLRTTADMLAGHSGGPAVNYDGSVIGWCVKSHREGASDKSAAGGLHALRPINDAKIQFRAAGLSIC